MRQKIFRSGNSLTVVVPAKFARQIGLKQGDNVMVRTDIEKGRLICDFPTPRQLQLEK